MINERLDTLTNSNKIVIRKGEFTEWTEVLCSDKIDRHFIYQLSKALHNKGYSVEISYEIDKNMKVALTKFQQDNNLPTGNLNFPTLKSLGISY